jgi:Mg2+ and Co2+ transporter CorA
MVGSARDAAPPSRGRRKLAKGTDHLLWALADDVIDGYFPILDQLGDEIDDLEDRSSTARIGRCSSGCSTSSAR